MNIQKEEICVSKLTRCGSEPGWSAGNSTIVRVGDRVFATAMFDVGKIEPYNCNCLQLFEKRGEEPWKRVFYDEGVLQREPCPIMYLGNNQLLITVNPVIQKYEEGEENRFVPCIPLYYLFDISGETKRIKSRCIPWDIPLYQFYDHSYRSFAKDQENGDMIFTNQYVDFSHKYVNGEGMYKEGYYAGMCYTVLDKDFKIVRKGTLVAPERALYQTIAMKNGETYILGVADNVESNAEYKQYKREMTGVSWDYDMSKLYLFYSPDIRKEDFRPYAIVSDKSATRGWVRSEDCCFDQNGDMLFLISAENVHFGFMRDRFFPEQPLETVLKVCRFSHGELIEETIVDRYMEENDIKVYYGGYFHTAENGEIYIVWSKENSLWNKPGDHRGDEGIPAVENAAVYLSKADELDKEPIKIFDVSGRIFGNKTRLGAEPGNIIDLYSYREDKAIYYSRCDLEYILER